MAYTSRKKPETHTWVKLESGFVTCSCGRVLPHTVVDTDADAVFDAHVANPELNNVDLLTLIFENEDE